MFMIIDAFQTVYGLHNLSQGYI